MKRKTLTMILCLLTVLSVVGVGFASWVINAGDEVSSTGNIQVDVVDDYRFTFGSTQELAEIHFGMDDSETISKAWLTNNQKNKENLSATFDITLTSASPLSDGLEATWNDAVEVTASYALAAVADDGNSADGVAAYNAAVTAKAIIVPETDLTVTFKNANATTATYTVTVEFAWGEAFDTERTEYYVKKTDNTVEKIPTIADDATNGTSDNLNPYKFYNATKLVDGNTVFTRPVGTWGDDANYYLELIEALGALKYNITVIATPTALK